MRRFIVLLIFVCRVVYLRSWGCYVSVSCVGIVMSSTALYCIVLYCIVLYCIVLYSVVLYCIVLDCIVLYIVL